jgi:hypothetical protein
MEAAPGSHALRMDMPQPYFADPIISTITAFLHDIGLVVHASDLPDTTFLPGIRIIYGELVVDQARLRFPGDLLHEAGHLAVVPAARRQTIHDNVGSDPAEEMMAIAWSYAAACHLAIDPALVFHEHGYRGGGASLLENFRHGYYVGVPMLQWLGMTMDERQAAQHQVAPYPHMLRWLRQDEPAPDTKSIQ